MARAALASVNHLLLDEVITQQNAKSMTKFGGFCRIIQGPLGDPSVREAPNMMAALRAAKQALRRDIKQRVSALSEQEKQRQSKVVSQKLFKHPKYASCDRIAVFLSMHDEVRTEEILQDLFAQGKTCFIPKYQTQGSHMDMLRLHSMHDMETLPLTSWNIKQPSDEDLTREEALATGGLDLILMPGLGFDRSGNRLGRGKGFYDTYLERCVSHARGKPYTIALAFKEQLCQEIPVDDNDVLIDEVLYEDPE